VKGSYGGLLPLELLGSEYEERQKCRKCVTLYLRYISGSRVITLVFEYFFKETYKHVALFRSFAVGGWPQNEKALEEQEPNNLL
jgi:hypothetical protein